jgi:hypothetical protein
METSVGAALGNLHPVLALLIALPCIVVLALWRRMERREEAFAARDLANMERYVAMSERMMTAINNSTAATDRLADAIADNKQRP